jgi:hypothetical protein
LTISVPGPVNVIVELICPFIIGHISSTILVTGPGPFDYIGYRYSKTDIVKPIKKKTAKYA